MGSQIEGDTVCVPDDVLLVLGPPAGISRVHELAGAPPWTPPQPVDDATVTEVDHAVDVLVEMKTLSEVAVGLAYAALLVGDRGLAGEVHHLAGGLDYLKDRLQLWVL